MRVANLKPKEDIKARHTKEDALVLEAMERLGGIVRFPVMTFRRYLKEPMRETHIKLCFKRLLERGIIRQAGERGDCKGFIYALVKK